MPSAYGTVQLGMLRARVWGSMYLRRPDGATRVFRCGVVSSPGGDWLLLHMRTFKMDISYNSIRPKCDINTVGSRSYVGMMVE